ncbi:iron-containing alcohol dehydrogenase [[Eubacterium] hominis]|uniref:iron-containing alcohol dehydrogenase n=1 Tax=[Eubacterium] hominis TaxID=2764325 RepID=UPI003A4D5034
MSNNLSIFNYAQTKVLFGSKALASLPKELERLQISKLFIVTDKVLRDIGLLAPLIEILELNSVSFVIYDNVLPDPASHTVDEAVILLNKESCNGVLGVGGGSVMDCAKCIAAMSTNEGRLLDYDHGNKDYKEFINQSLPLISIPTTSGTGSEVSPYAVITNEKEHRKATIGSSSLISRVALLDPLFLQKLPPKVIASTGMDAFTHCIEAYASKSSSNEPNPIIDALALKGIEMISRSIVKAYETGDGEAREDLMWGSLIGGIVLPYGSGASHGLGNILGGELHVPHGVAVGMLLPHVIEFNYDIGKNRYDQIANMMCLNQSKEVTIVDHIQGMLEKMKFPVLSDFVGDDEELRRISNLAVKDKCTRINIKNVSIEDAYQIYKKAMERKML